MTVRSRLLGSLALVATAGLVLTGCTRPSSNASPTPTVIPTSIKAADCAPEATNANTLKIGTVLPLTGPSYLGGYAQLAAVNKAVADITKAGGVPLTVSGKTTYVPACIVSLDSGAGMDAAAGLAAGTTLAGKQVSIILSTLSSEGTSGILSGAPGIPVISLTSVSTSLSNMLYRVGPPSWAQAQALTNTLIVDGSPKIAMVGPVNATTTATRLSIQAEFAEQKGLVLFGAIDPTPAPVTKPTPSATPKTVAEEVTAAIAAKPDAIVIVASSETTEYLQQLIAQRWKMPKTYLIDSNVVDYSKSFAEGALLAVQGTVPGQSPNDELKAYVNDWSLALRNKAIESVNYAAEAYDATVLAALAAVNYAHTQPSYLASSLMVVSGSYGGDLCYSYADCATPLSESKRIHYKGPSGIGPFTGAHEVSSSMISIYQYKADNTPVWTGLVSVRSVKEPRP